MAGTARATAPRAGSRSGSPAPIFSSLFGDQYRRPGCNVRGRRAAEYTETEDPVTGDALPASARASLAARLMGAYARETGLRDHAPQRRYLWTDSYAVANCLALHAIDPTAGWFGLAADLVAAVHHVLGRHRPDDPRTGWISGLDEAAGVRHPTAGGLRIGKPLPERPPEELVHPGLEWDRDGQYYHYLTRWMRALDRFARALADPDAERWARELAVAAYRGFAHDAGTGRIELVWKMSVDLSRPLVASTGHLDPLDGLVTAESLRAGRPLPELAPAIEGLTAMCADRNWATDDPLGAGGLLEEVATLATLVRRGFSDHEDLLARMLDDADRSLDALDADRLLSLPADRRVAFRELGLAIGLAAVSRLATALEADADPVADWLRPDVRRLAARAPLGECIVAFWSEPAPQASPSWTEHTHISAVMLATALLPDGWLGDAGAHGPG